MARASGSREARAPNRVRVVREQRNEGLLVRRRVRTQQRQHELRRGWLWVVPKPKEDDDDVEVAHAYQLREAFGGRPFVDAGRMAQALAQLCLLIVVDAQDAGEHLRLGLTHLRGRRAAEEHRHFLIEVEQILDKP